jgi:acyl-CoA thioesterase-1
VASARHTVVLAGCAAVIALASGAVIDSTAPTKAHAVAVSPSASYEDLKAPVSHTLLFVGASYTAGLGASSPDEGYAADTARDLGWTAQINAVAGSGYLNPGPHRQGTFSQRIQRLPANPEPGLVIIQGGRNDAAYSAATLRSAVCVTVSDVRRKYPAGEVVLLGNIPISPSVGPPQLSVERSLSSASRTCRVPFIDPIAQHWVTRSNARSMQGRIPGHPNDLGYTYIAHRLVQALAQRSHGKISPQ